MHKHVHSIKMKEVEELLVKVVDIDTQVAGMWAGRSSRGRSGSRSGGHGSRSSKPFVLNATPETAECTSSHSHDKQDYRKKTFRSNYPFKVMARENSRSTLYLFPKLVLS